MTTTAKSAIGVKITFVLIEFELLQFSILLANVRSFARVEFYSFIPREKGIYFIIIVLKKTYMAAERYKDSILEVQCVLRVSLCKDTPMRCNMDDAGINLLFYNKRETQ